MISPVDGKLNMKVSSEQVGNDGVPYRTITLETVTGEEWFESSMVLTMDDLKNLTIETMVRFFNAASNAFYKKGFLMKKNK